jgi:hypothetical protein
MEMDNSADDAVDGRPLTIKVRLPVLVAVLPPSFWSSGLIFGALGCTSIVRLDRSQDTSALMATANNDKRNIENLPNDMTCLLTMIASS